MYTIQLYNRINKTFTTIVSPLIEKVRVGKQGKCSLYSFLDYFVSLFSLSVYLSTCA